MKTSTVGLASAAILMVMAGAGFGIAQAGGNHIDRPVLSFEDQEALEQGNISSPSVENRPVLAFDDSSYSPLVENRPVLSFEDVTQMENPIETGNLPAENNSGSSIVETEGNMYRAGEDTENPIETGSLPAENNSGSSMVETEGNMYRAGEDTGAP